MTLPPSWLDQLSLWLNRSKGDDRSRFPRTCLVGVGSDLRGDDSAGLAVVRRLLEDERCRNAPNLLILEGGPAPENQTGRIRAFQPELVMFVDAAQMDEPPGTIRWIPFSSIDGMSASSHSLPLSLLAQYISAEIGCDVAVLGIQPGQNEMGEKLAPSVSATIDEIVAEIRHILDREV